MFQTIDTIYKRPFPPLGTFLAFFEKRLFLDPAYSQGRDLIHSIGSSWASAVYQEWNLKKLSCFYNFTPV